MSPTIRVGVLDWCEFAPGDGYYPADLPTEWRLDYFSNEFETACLSMRNLMHSTEHLLAWTEDLDDDFELSFHVQTLEQLELLTRLRNRSGFSIRYLLVDEADSDILLHLKSSRAVSCDAATEHFGQLVSLADLWRPAADSPGNGDIALMPAAASPRQYRDWIEDWLSDNPHGAHLTLWLDAAHTDYRTLHDCRSLVEIMGY